MGTAPWDGHEDLQYQDATCLGHLPYWDGEIHAFDDIILHIDVYTNKSLTNNGMRGAGSQNTYMVCNKVQNFYVGPYQVEISQLDH